MGGPWIPASSFLNLDLIGGPWNPASPFKIWTDLAVRGTLLPLSKFGPIRPFLDPCTPFLKFGPNRPSLDSCFPVQNLDQFSGSWTLPLLLSSLL